NRAGLKALTKLFKLAIIALLGKMAFLTKTALNFTRHFRYGRRLPSGLRYEDAPESDLAVILIGAGVHYRELQGRTLLPEEFTIASQIKASCGAGQLFRCGGSARCCLS